MIIKKEHALALLNAAELLKKENKSQDLKVLHDIQELCSLENTPLCFDHPCGMRRS